MNKNFFRTLILALALVSCQARETEVVVLSLNDLHAKIDDLDKVAAYVKEVRAKNPNVLLLSAGDLFSGNPVVDYCHDRGFPLIDLMNDIGFDATALGNHEFDYGQEVLAKRIAQAGFPFICANIRIDSSPLPALKPCVFFTKSKERICVVGLIQERPETHESKIQRLAFTNPLEEFSRYAALRKKCNLLIALTHVGVLQDTLLASRYREIDLVVGGHSHTKLDSGVLIGGVLVTQAGRYVSYIGKTNVRLRNGKVVSKRNSLISVAQLMQRDSAVTRKIERYNDSPELQQVVGTLGNAIAGGFNIGNFFCDAVRSQTNADIAFQNLHGVRVEVLHKGKLTKKDLYLADPFGNEIVLLEMSGGEVLQFIANVYNRFHRLDLCVSGITYRVKATESATTVQAFLPDGKPLDLHKKYSVVMNSYMSTKTEDYPLPVSGSGAGLGITTAEATEQYMRQQKVVSFASPTRAATITN
jgi:2',3'-cyclic-nucleotide 2'-phosphodiesterase (5'-nucleotidase family)